jgi:hypothetical protein
MSIKKDDVVVVATGCPDCGDVECKVLDVFHNNALLEIIGDLPHKVKERRAWCSVNRLKLKE